MRNVLFLIIVTAFFSGTASAYDKKMAESYESYFSPFIGMKTGKAMQLISAKSLVASQRKGDNLFVLDVRSPGETAVYGFNWTNSLTVPMNEVFKPDNLAKIPDNMKIVVVCKGGMRAATIATGLRHIGFKNVFILKKGIAGLAKYLSAGTPY